MKDLRTAGLGEDVCVLDADVLCLGAAVRSRWDVGVEDTLAGEGSAIFGLDYCAVGVVFDYHGVVVVGHDAIAWHGDPVGHFEGWAWC